MSVQDSGSAVRVASATARQYLLALAAELLGVQPHSLSVEDGTITSIDANEQTDLLVAAGRSPVRGQPCSRRRLLKDPHDYRIVGRKQRRLDVPDKVQGNVAFRARHDSPAHALRRSGEAAVPRCACCGTCQKP